MHELAIVEQVLALALERSGGARVTRVVLEIGKLSAVLPDAVRFAFDLASEGTVAEGAALEIREPPGLATCDACAAQVVLERPFGRCACGSTALTWVSGEQLCVKELEVTSELISAVTSEVTSEVASGAPLPASGLPR